jgi:hypothetical protein
VGWLKLRFGATHARHHRPPYHHSRYKNLFCFSQLKQLMAPDSGTGIAYALPQTNSTLYTTMFKKSELLRKPPCPA